MGMPALLRRLARVLRRRVRAAWAVTCLLVLAYIGHGFLGRIAVADLAGAMASSEPWRLAAAIVCTVLCFLCLTINDGMGLRALGHALPFRRLLKAACVTYGLSHVTGFSAVAQWAVRWRMYGRLNIRTADVTALSAICGLASTTGMCLRLGFAVLYLSVHHRLDLGFAGLPGGILAVGILIPLLLVILSVTMNIGRISAFIGRTLSTGIGLPWRTFVAMVAISCLEVLFAASAFHFLVEPFVGASILQTFCVFVIAAVAGVASQLPAGIGAFEFVMIMAFEGTSPVGIVAAAALFRIVFYFIPFVLAGILFAASYRRSFDAAEPSGNPSPISRNGA